jgi:hypothetical protein
MIIDATCAPSNIRYPQDTSLLNEARENAEAIIDKLHTPERQSLWISEPSWTSASATDWTRLEVLSFDAYNEALNLQAMAERYRERTDRYPSRILADKIYRNRDNLVWCRLRHIRLTGPALGRPKKDEVRNRKQDYRDECERIEVERRFSLAKRKYGLGLIMTKLEETIFHSIAMSVVVLNLRKIQRALLRALLIWLDTLGFTRKFVFVQ